MANDRIAELRLDSFKSYEDVRIAFEPLTILIGRNGSGKSNALDALEIVSRLARGDEVRDALEGNRRDAEPVRGGAEGCAPPGADSFTLGVTVATALSEKVTLDVTVQVRPQVQIVRERLCAYTAKGRWRTLLETEPPAGYGADLRATVWNDSRGRNPMMQVRSSHLITAQLPLRLAGKTKAEQHLLAVSESVLAVLAGVFHLDPVPHLMRQYVPEQDLVLRRTAENLSASIARLKQDREKFSRLLAAVRELPEYDVRALEIGKGGYGDVMLALKERRGRGSTTVPARQMSDGMLRMLAIVTALLSGGPGLAVDQSATGRSAATLMLVIEELENGLHPSQAAKLLELVTEASREGGYQVVLTTHSPALLNALPGDRHPGVVVVERDGTSGRTSATRLVDMPGYVSLMAQSRLGDAVAAGRIPEARRERQQMTAADLDSLLGIG